jgi:hypothetical protein
MLMACYSAALLGVTPSLFAGSDRVKHGRGGEKISAKFSKRFHLKNP